MRTPTSCSATPPPRPPSGGHPAATLPPLQRGVRGARGVRASRTRSPTRRPGRGGRSRGRDRRTARGKTGRPATNPAATRTPRRRPPARRRRPQRPRRRSRAAPPRRRPCPSADPARPRRSGRVERIAPAAAARRPDPDHLAGPHRLGVRERVDLPLARAAGVDRHLERPPRAPAGDPPAGQDRAVGDRHERRVAEHPDVLLVAEPASIAARAAGVDGQPEPLDPQRKARLAELRRDVPASPGRRGSCPRRRRSSGPPEPPPSTSRMRYGRPSSSVP